MTTTNRLADIHEVLLMGPGPSCVPPQVYQALSLPTIGHLDPTFIAVMDEIKQQLAALLKTQGGLTMPLSGTGSSGMEAAFVNLVEPGDPVLVLINGVFGVRMKEVASRLGADVDSIETEWGKPVEADRVRERVEARRYKIVAVVHAETSTGVANPVGEIGEVVGGRESLYLVDCVTSLGGMDVDAAAWGADVIYSGTQKCLSCPPGLAPITFSDRALDVISNRQRKAPNWYLDVSLLAKYWSGGVRAYHHTAPINMLYGLYAALDVILTEGLDAVFARHAAAHQALVAGLDKLGLSMLVDPPWRLPMLNAVNVPEDVDEAAVRKSLLQRHRIEIGAGLGPLSGKIWRVGLMGHTARPGNVQRFLDALAQTL